MTNARLVQVSGMGHWTADGEQTLCGRDARARSDSTGFATGNPDGNVRQTDPACAACLHVLLTQAEVIEPAPPALDTLGGRLRAARTARGMGSNELGRLAKVADGYVSRIENGERERPSGTHLAAIARALGVSLEWLLNGEGPSPL